MADRDLDCELATLGSLSPSELRARWGAVTTRPVSRISPSLLRLALAWEMQAAVHGGLSRKSQQTLDQFASGKTETRSPQPGMRLLREWNGSVQVVTVGDDGMIHWNDRQWRSLSAVARAITGTRWLGRAFFGLRQRKAA